MLVSAHLIGLKLFSKALILLLGRLQKAQPLGDFGNRADFFQETNTAIGKYKHPKVMVSTDSQYLTNSQETYGSLFIRFTST